MTSESHALDESVESHGEKTFTQRILYCYNGVDVEKEVWLEFNAMYFLKTGADVTKGNAQRDTAFS